ncbi:AI-2E family transporter [Candidatus Woesearchaeota archaeon]|nr:AI-2E family transporter [Candidatus Woesearchaeota archaeon]
MKQKTNINFFIVVLLLFLYLSALVVWPYMGFIILSIVIAYAAYPLYERILRWLKRPWLASAIMVFLAAVVLFLPSIFLMRELVSQASSTISSIDMEVVTRVTDRASELLHVNLDVASIISTTTSRMKDFFLNESISVISGIADSVIGIIITFFVLFYLFRDGKHLYRAIYDLLPLNKKHKDVLFGEMQIVTNAVIYGQLIIALIQGLLGGLAFLIFGLENPVFWGFIIAIISFLPVIGTLVIFIPAGLLQLSHGNLVPGFGIIIFGVVLVMNVDSIVRPLIISEKSRLNAALILIGVIGGLKAFGFMGFVLGPLVLALLISLLQAYRKDFRPSKELREAQKKKDALIVPLHSRPPDEHRVDDDEERKEATKKP